MKTKTKRILLVLTLVVAIAVVVGLLWKTEPPQILTLPNGEQYQFVAAIWGTNDVQPTFAAWAVARLPAPLAKLVQQKLGDRFGLVAPSIRSVGASWPYARNPPEPSLHVWFRSIGMNASGLPPDISVVMLADQNGAAVGSLDGWSLMGQGENKWLSSTFSVVPRRSATLDFCLFQGANPVFGPYREIGRARFPNPLFGRFPQWQPDTLPVTKMAGDLEIRLTDFTVGAMNRDSGITVVNGRKTRFHRPTLGERPEAVFKVEVNSPRGTNESWLLHRTELSDATGNRVRVENLGRWGGSDEYSVGPALWPDEGAWRLKLEWKRSRGRDPAEIVTFKNVPLPSVGATNTFFLTNRIQGVPVVLRQEFWRQANMTIRILKSGLESRITAEFPGKPAGVALDFVQLTADTGWKLTAYSGGRSDFSRIILVSSIPTNATTVDITWAVQKTRSVEFLVKPPKAE